MRIIKVKCCEECPYHDKTLWVCNHNDTTNNFILRNAFDSFPIWCPLRNTEEDEEDTSGLVELINIMLTPEDAAMFFEILCELPYRKATSYDNEPPTEREESVESVINQLYTHLHYDEEVIDSDEI